MAVLAFCDMNFKAADENAAANVDEVEAKELLGVKEPLGDCGIEFLVGCRRSCSALASAFSWVRM